MGTWPRKEPWPRSPGRKGFGLRGRPAFLNLKKKRSERSWTTKSRKGTRSSFGTKARRGGRVCARCLLRLRQSWAKRLGEWKQPKPRYAKGVLAKYAEQVSAASLGAVTD